MAASEAAVFARRWAGFVAAIWLMALSGPYGFSNYSTALKDVLGINQAQLNRLSVAKDLGDSGGVLAGILSNYVPAYTLLCIGAAASLTGNGIQWLVVKQLIGAPPYWVMFIVAAVAGNTMSWVNTSVFTLSFRNFPRNRGSVAGILKGYMGLSAALYSHFCDSFFSSSPSMYLLMLATIPSMFCLITAFFYRLVPPSETVEDEKVEQKSILMFNILAIALALTLTTKNLVPSLQQGMAGAVPVIVVFVLLALPALVPIMLFFGVKKRVAGESCSGEVGHGFVDGSSKAVAGSIGQIEEGDLTNPLLDHSKTHLNGSDCEKISLHDGCDFKERECVSLPSLQLGDDWPTLSLFTKWHAYVLYITFFFGTGTGMSFANNLGQVGQSFGFTTVTLFTSLFSLGNFFGRITAGNISEYCLKRLGTPRPTWIGVAKLPMIALFIWLSFGSVASLYAGSMIVGFSHGSLITLNIPTVSEFYGLKHFGTNYMCLNTHIVAGSIIFSGVIAGYLYDRNATYQDGDSSLTCYGAACYGTTFRLYAVCLIVGLFLDGVLSFVSRHLYLHLKHINVHSQGKEAHRKA